MRENWTSIGVTKVTKSRFDEYLKMMSRTNRERITADELLSRLLNMAGAPRPRDAHRRREPA